MAGTGNPIGSTAFADFEYNVGVAVDNWTNSTADTVLLRTINGVQREIPTLNAIVTVGQNGIDAINADVAAVESAKTVAINTIDNNKNFVQNYASDAVDDINVKLADVESAKNTAINTTIPSYESDVQDRADTAINTNIPAIEQDVQDRANQADTQIDSIVENTQDLAEAKLDDVGFIYKDPETFETGSTLSGNAEALLWSVDDGGNGEYYRWTGTFPKLVPANSTPASTGGVGEGAWKAAGFNALLQDLGSSDADKGALLVKRATVNVETLADAEAVPAPIGTIIETEGYYASGDGGANRYVVVAGGTGTADGVDYINMNNGNQLESLTRSITYGPNQPEDQGGINQGPPIRRATNTVQDLDIFVDTNVSTSGDGSQSSPLKTINEALALVPRNIYHKVHIYLADGLYVGSGNTFNLYNYFVTPRSTAGFKIFGHCSENPLYNDLDKTAVVIGDASASSPTFNNLVIGGVIGDADDVYMKGLTIDARVQNYGTPYCFFNVDFKTGVSGNVIDGHSGRMKLVNCGYFDCDTPIVCQDLAHIYVEGSETEYSNINNVADVNNASILMFDDSASHFARAGNILFEDECIVKVGKAFVQDSDYVFSSNTPEGFERMRVNFSGDIIAGRGLRGKFGAVTSVDNNTFALYQADDGSIFLRVKDSLGTEKIIKLFNFTAGTIGP